MTGDPTPGQVWRPGLPGSIAKLVTRTTPGGLYATEYPLRGPHVRPAYYTRPAWDSWAQRFRALPDARAVQLSEAPR